MQPFWPFIHFIEKYKVMKATPLIFSLLIFALFSSCTKDLNCEGDCVFIMENAEAKVLYLNCFEKYGFMIEDGNEQIVGIPDKLANRFEEDDLEVVFDAEFRPNDITPVFPDPVIGAMPVYQIKISKIKIQ